MTDFPSKELLEVIRGQARMEEKLDQFLKSQSALSQEVSVLKVDVSDLKSARKSDKAYIAGASTIISGGMIFIIPYLKQKFGL